MVIIVAILGCMALYKIISNKKILAACLAVITAIMFAQSFMPIDFISNHLVQTVDTGTNKMLYSAQNSHYYGDCLIYNRQYAWIDPALNKALEDTKYSKNSQAIIVGAVSRASEIDGGRNGSASSYTVYWDPENNERTMQPGDGRYAISGINTDSIFSIVTAPLKKGYSFNPDILYNNAVITFIPYYDIDEQEVMNDISRYYYIGPRNIYRSFGGEIVYYDLVKKLDPFDGFSLDNVQGSSKPPYPIDSSEEYLAPSSKISLDLTQEEITQEEIDEYIDSLLRRHSRVFLKDEDDPSVELNDIVTIQYDSTIDGQPYYNDGIINLHVGSGEFIEDFDLNFLNMKIGDTFSFSCTFPEDYETDPEVRGKTMVYSGEIAAITQFKIIPELTLDFIQKYTPFTIF
jgi:hypothetical protein